MSALIDDVWSWERVDERLTVSTQSRLERVERAAKQPCICGGVWRELAEKALTTNGISPSHLCGDVLRSLRDGRREDRPVVVLVGRRGGEGKSFLLAPLRRLFGNELTQHTPQPGTFPLLGLEKKALVLLDEWSFDEAAVPLSTQLLWFEGKPFPLSRPQNRSEYSGHFLYEGTAPIFVTCKEVNLAPLYKMAAEATATGGASEWTMLLRRLQLVWFTQPFVPPEDQVPECVTCFSKMLLHHAASTSTSSGSLS